MDEADDVVERLAVDGHTRMAMLDEQFDQVAKRLLDIERDDVDARHHHVSGAAVVNFEDVADQDPLLRRDRTFFVAARLGDHSVDRLARIARPPDQPQQAAQAPHRAEMLGMAVTTGRLGFTHQV